MEVSRRASRPKNQGHRLRRVLPPSSSILLVGTGEPCVLAIRATEGKKVVDERETLILF
jgi:hypothetical protein